MSTDLTTLKTTQLGKYIDCPHEAIESALSQQMIQAQAGNKVLLGELLLETGAISREQLLTALTRQRVERIKACSLFSRLSIRHLEQLSQSFEDIAYAADETFIVQDTTDHYLYILATGQLQVYRRDEFDESIPLVVINPGEAIGEMAYFSDGLRSASVKASVASNLVRIHYAELAKFLDSFPKLANAFLKLVTERLRKTNLAYEDNVHRRITAERSLKNLNEFLDLSEVLELRLGIEGLIERVVHTASRLMKADRASLFLIDPASGDLWSKVAEGEEVKEIRIPAGKGIAGWVANNRETLNILDAYEDERFNPEIDRKTGYRTRTILCGPVFSLKGDVIGVIQVINKKAGNFVDDDISLFRAFAHQAAVSIENFNLYRKVISSHEKMAILLDIASTVTQTLDLPTLISRIVKKIPEILRCDRSSFFMLDKNTNELWSVEAQGSELREIRFPADAGLAGYSVSHAEIVNIPDAYADARFNPEFDKQTGYKTHTVLCLPLKNRQGEVTGVTQAINKQDGAFQEDDINLLQAVSAQIAVSVENARLYADTMQMKSYLESVQESISNSILALNNHYEVVTANKSALRLFSLSRDDLIGKDLKSVVNESNVDLFEQINSVSESSKSVVRYDVEIDLMDGKRTINLNIVPLITQDGEKNGLVIVIDDITREKRAHSTLGRYMPKDIVERLMQDTQAQKLGGVRSNATILFNDIRNFTSLSEKLGAEETMDFLNEYFSLMVDEVFSHNGLLDKFIGDAMMAVFGVPFTHHDDAIRAVKTAINMQNQLVAFNQRRIQSGYDNVEIGIGINTGEVISGNMGSEKRMDFTVIGDGVNTASRLETLNKHYGTRILISQSVYEKVHEHFKLLPIDTVLLKGKSIPTAIYEVLGDETYELTEIEKTFAQGIANYRQHQFENALNWFQREEQNDERCQIFSARCRQFMQVPPPENWDGVWRVTEK